MKFDLHFFQRVFRANIKTDNIDNNAVEQIRREIAKADKKITVLRHDNLMLTAKLDLLGRNNRENLNSKSSFQSIVDYTENNDSDTTL